MADIDTLINKIDKFKSSFQNIMAADDVLRVSNMINALEVKLQDDDNYLILSNKNDTLKQMILHINEERASLDRQINDINFNISMSSLSAESIRDELSTCKKELEDLAKEINASENSDLLPIINSKREQMNNIKERIEVIDKQLTIQKQEKKLLDDKKIDLDNKYEQYNDELKTSVNNVDETKKHFDMQRLILYKQLLKITYIKSKLDEISHQLYVLKYEPQKENTIDKEIEELYSLIESYRKNINLDQLEKYSQNFSKRLDDENNYLVSNIDEEIIQAEINDLERTIGLYQTYSFTDTQSLIAYNNNLEMNKNEIKRETANKHFAEKQIKSLTMGRNSITIKSFVSETDKKIKFLTQQIKITDECIERLLKNQLYIENCISAIKRKKRSWDSLKANKMEILEAKKKAANTKTDVLKMISDAEVLSVINKVINATKCINEFTKKEEIKEEQMTANDEFIKTLQDQGLNVVTFGEAPESMLDSKVKTNVKGVK